MVFQLGSTLLDACVLAVLTKGDAYGYTLTQQVKTVLDISESTCIRSCADSRKISHLILTTSPIRAATEDITGSRIEGGSSTVTT